MDPINIAILDDYQGCALNMADWETLRAAGKVNITVFREHMADPGLLAEKLRPFNIVVVNRERTPLSAELLSALPKLRLIATSGQRNTSIDIEAATRLGITVSGTETLGYPTVELSWALILACVRHLPAELEHVRQGGWQLNVGTGLRGKTLGLLGFGRIGTEMATIAHAFGMKTLAWSRNMTQERAASQGAQAASLPELLAESDLVSLHMHPLPHGEALMDEKQLSFMKSTAFLINTSRGSLVDEAALAASLKARRIAGAALDVYQHEPLALDSPLRQLDNVLLSPHLGYVIEENYQQSFGQIVENIQAWLVGSPIRVISAKN